MSRFQNSHYPQGCIFVFPWSPCFFSLTHFFLTCIFFPYSFLSYTHLFSFLSPANLVVFHWLRHPSPSIDFTCSVLFCRSLSRANADNATRLDAHILSLFSNSSIFCVASFPNSCFFGCAFSQDLEDVGENDGLCAFRSNFIRGPTRGTKMMEAARRTSGQEVCHRLRSSRICTMKHGLWRRTFGCQVGLGRFLVNQRRLLQYTMWVIFSFDVQNARNS